MKTTIIVSMMISVVALLISYFYAVNYMFSRSVASYVVDLDSYSVYETYEYTVSTPNIVAVYIAKAYGPIITSRRFKEIQAHIIYLMVRSSFPNHKDYGLHSAELYYTRYTDTLTAIDYMPETFNQLDWSKFKKIGSFNGGHTKTFTVRDLK